MSYSISPYNLFNKAVSNHYVRATGYLSAVVLSIYNMAVLDNTLMECVESTPPDHAHKTMLTATHQTELIGRGGWPWPSHHGDNEKPMQSKCMPLLDQYNGSIYLFLGLLLLIMVTETLYAISETEKKTDGVNTIETAYGAV